MTDFPKGGTVEATRLWLDKKGFEDVFVGWKADAILGLDKVNIRSMFSEEDQDRALMLWGFLNTARRTTGAFHCYM